MKGQGTDHGTSKNFKVVVDLRMVSVDMIKKAEGIFIAL